MTTDLRFLGIAGSLRAASYNRAALRAAGELVPAGVTLTTYELDHIPPYNDDLWPDAPQPVQDLKAAVRAADAIVFATPEYNYSIPGVLKNAIDWASRPYGDNAWKNKPVAVLGVSGGAVGTARAQYHLRQCFVFLEMPALNQPELLINFADKKFDAQRHLTDEPTRQRIAAMLQALADWTRRLSPASHPETAIAR